MSIPGRAFALFALASLLSLGACSGASQPSPAMPVSAPASVIGGGGGFAAGYKCFTPSVFKPSWAAYFGAINDRGEIPGL